MSLFSVYLIISVKNKKIYSYVGYTNNLKIGYLSIIIQKVQNIQKVKMENYIFKNYKSKSRAMSEEYKLKKN